MPEAPVVVSVSVSRERDGVALIHLNRPPANSYNRAFLDDLNAAIDEVRWDADLRAAVLVSDLAPRFFSAGADVTNFLSSTQAERVMTVLHAHEILLKIEHTPKVFVAALHGHALGGGLEIALACDFRFAAEGEYRLGLPEVGLGLLPGNGGTQRLQRLIGRTRALDLMLTGTPVNATRALELGLVDRVFPADALVTRRSPTSASSQAARRWPSATSRSPRGWAPTCRWRAHWRSSAKPCGACS